MSCCICKPSSLSIYTNFNRGNSLNDFNLRSEADILVIDDRLRYLKQNPCVAEKKKFLLAVLPFTSGYHSGWIHIFDFAQI